MVIPPGLYLDQPIIAFANSIDADFDIDLYANPSMKQRHFKLFPNY